MSIVTLNYEGIKWSDIFELDSQSPSGIVWKGSRRSQNGKVAGAKNYDARTKEPHMWRVNTLGKIWAVHRIILIMLGKDISGKIIDHKDGNPFNNSIGNLRIVDQRINTQNKKKNSSNTSGVTGVSEGSNGQGRAYFIAHWLENNRQCSKIFSIDDLGYDVAFSLACEHRKYMISELNKRGNSYTDRHGE